MSTYIQKIMSRTGDEAVIFTSTSVVQEDEDY